VERGGRSLISDKKEREMSTRSERKKLFALRGRGMVPPTLPCKKISPQKKRISFLHN